MEEKKLCLQPGDRVMFKKDVGAMYDGYGDNQITLVATKGSIGVVVTPEEYKAFYNQLLVETRTEKSKYYKAHITSVKGLMDDCLRYPIRFEVVMPPSIPTDLICCKVGEIELIDVSNGYELILEKVE
jgi:hypothetical protein